MRHFKARRVLFAAGDLDQVARAAHPTGAEIVAEADQRVELPLRGRDVVAAKKVVELGLIRLDLAHQKKLRLFARDALGIILGHRTPCRSRCTTCRRRNTSPRGSPLPLRSAQWPRRPARISRLLAIAAGTQSCTARHSARSTASGDLFLMFCFISFLSFCRNRAKTPTL